MGYFPAPHTIFKHVRKLEPGHWLRMRNGEVEVRRYWDVEEFDTDRRALPLIEAELEEMLGLAVHRRLESEVPLGAFLSGGIDSGLIVSFMCDTLGPDVLTATVGFGQEDYNEIPASRLVAERFKSQHVTEVVEPDLSEILGPIVGAFDEPFADDSAIPTYYVSMMARRHVTVALSGDGGDESFGGYDFRYVPHAWECRLRPWLSAGPAQSLLRWLGSHWSRSTRMPRALRLGTVCENLARSAADAYYLDLCFQKPADARRLLGEEASPDPRRSSVYEAITSPYRRCPSKSALQRAQYADLKVYLPNMPLVKVDRMSMHHSLEIRSPLLDHSVVEFAFRVPTESKLPKLEAKHLLRRLAQRRLPPELLQLPKQGFSTPIGNWIRGPLREQFQDEVFSSSSRIAEWLDIPTLRSYFTEHCRRRVNRSWALWSVWVLERWCQLHMEEELRPVSGRSLRD
jgi:asparagine synthase (glutamine-hydrolysing)